MKKARLKKCAVAVMVVTGLTAALTGVTDAEMAGEVVTASRLEACFGNNGAAFTMTPESNDMAVVIKEHMGTANWGLLICRFDSYDNWEVMQYYDISSRCEIPSVDVKTVTFQKAEEVYYSHPNRIVLLYEGGEMIGDHTEIGEIEATDNLKRAVVSNPILQDQNNKTVQIKSIR